MSSGFEVPRGKRLHIFLLWFVSGVLYFTARFSIFPEFNREIMVSSALLSLLGAAVAFFWIFDVISERRR